jgi:GTP-binding protein
VAVEEADVIIHLADARLGVTEADAAIARELRRSGAKVVLTVNKLDNPADDSGRYPFYALGEGEPYAISASHGLGMGDLLDVVVSLLPEDDEPEKEASLPRVAVIGRPNVGKSTLLNRLLGSERAVVSEVAGTTTDAVEHEIEVQDASEGAAGRFLLLDTAGVNRSARRAEGVPYYSTLKTEGAIRRSDVSLLLVDAIEGLVSEDLRLARRVEEAAGRAASLSTSATSSSRAIARDRGHPHRQDDRPETPSLVRLRLHRGGDGQGDAVSRPAVRRVQPEDPTHEVAEFINDLVDRSPPPKGVKIRFAAQTGTSPPRFIPLRHPPEGRPRWLPAFRGKLLRERYGLYGVSVRLRLRSSR